MQIFDFETNNQILQKATEYNSKFDEKVIYVFAGPNGSGKSTLIANLYLNGKLNAEYVNADIYCNTNFKDIENIDERNKAAMFYTTDKVNSYLKQGKSFCYETVLSHPSKIQLFKQAKKLGYKIISTFVYTNNPQINIDRVAARSKQGGHDVPKEKIISRYYRSLEYAKDLEKISNEFSNFDNSLNQKIVCKNKNG